MSLSPQDSKNNTLLKQLKPILWGCNLFGFTYIVTNKTKNRFLKQAEVFLSTPITLLYIFCIYEYSVTILSGNVHHVSRISKISDPLSLIACVLTFFIKWMYYFFKRNKTKIVVSEVLFISLLFY